MADFPMTSGVVQRQPTASDKKDRPYLGSSVKDGRIRYSSVSQVVIASPDQEGGCLRRWAGIYLFGHKEEKSVAQLAGNKFASSQEHYLKTGEDVLERELRPIKHLLPKPGPDLEVERALGPDPAAAIALRDRLLFGGLLQPDTKGTQLEIERLAGLTAVGVPLIGAFDFRHHRGEYIDPDGVLRKEDPGHVVGETVDLKTTSRIHDHTTRGGTFLQGKARSPEQVGEQPQMIGYGVADANENPNLTHVRLGHLYAQTKNGYVGAKRTVLLTVDDVRERWRTRVEPRMREMIDIAATVTDMNQAPANFFSCTQFHQPCSQVPFCDRRGYTILDFYRRREGETMGNGLFDDLAITPESASAHVSGSGLFSTLAPVEEIPDLPEPTEAERAAATSAEVARLKAEDQAGKNGTVHRPPPAEVPGDVIPASACKIGTSYFVTCEEGRPPIKMKFSEVSTKGQRKFVDVLGGIARLEPTERVRVVNTTTGCGVGDCGKGAAPGWVLLANGMHSMCKSCQGTGRPIGAVNPPDATQGGLLEDAAALPPEAVAEITNPAFKAKVEAHAAAHAEKAAREAKEKPQKAGGRCPGGEQVVAITTNARGTRWVVCGVCKEERRVPKEVAADATSAPMPGHNLPKEETPPAVPEVPVAVVVSEDDGAPDLPDVPVVLAVKNGLPAHLAQPASSSEELSTVDAREVVVDVIADLQRAISVLGTLGALGDDDDLAPGLRAKALALVEGAARGLCGGGLFVNPFEVCLLAGVVGDLRVGDAGASAKQITDLNDRLKFAR